MPSLKNDDVRQAVRKNYGEVAKMGSMGGCGQPPSPVTVSSCCGTDSTATCCTPNTEFDLSPEKISVNLGYSNDDVNGVPEGANMGLGCGNPQAIAALKPGETVLDLGSGGGFDSFLAAKAVGESGFVIGVDMTPAMLSKARENTVKAGFKNVDFRLGEIENLPVADNTIDVILSNCVINLSPEKQKVFNESFRVLKPGGRLAISDVVATAELPDEWQKDLTLLTGCMSGASLIDELNTMLEKAGFTHIQIQPKDESREFIRHWAPGTQIEDYVVSATIEAIKP